jgi:hypothetical protein
MWEDWDDRKTQNPIQTLANNNITKIKGRAPWPVMNSIIYLDLNNNNLGDSLDGGKVL